jgi:biopolymer transport protein ExbB/TolQ
MFLVQKFNEGGIFMYAIFAFAILSFTLIIERYFTLYKKEVEAKSSFRTQLLNFISQGDFTSAIRFAETQNSTESASLARIAKIGCTLRAQGAGDEEIQARMDEALSNEIHNIDRNTGFLGMFGNVATLLGLLGTITGMIHSFAAVASANPADRATMLSRGISEAMNCTAFGLIVAIPALIAFAVYQNKTDRLVAKLTGLTSEIFHDILFLTAKRPTQTLSNNSRSEAHPMN